MKKHTDRGVTIATLGISMVTAQKTLEKLAKRGLISGTVNGIHKLDPVITADTIGKSITSAILSWR